MAEAKRRGYGEGGIYFDHGGGRRDSAHHKTCPGRWRGVVSLGFDAGGKRIRKKVSGQTRTEVKDKLKDLHSELDAGVRSVQGYTVETAVTDWLADGMPGRAAKTVEVYRDALRPLMAVIGRLPLRDLTVQDGRTDRAGEDGGHPFHPDAAKGAQLPDAGAAARRGQGSRPPERLGAGGHSARAGGAAVAGADPGAGGRACGGTSARSPRRPDSVAVGCRKEIARLAGHASSRTTEVIYRRELRPVITTGAEVMDQIFRPRHVRPVGADAAG